jgi:hypothetical protein
MIRAGKAGYRMKAALVLTLLLLTGCGAIATRQPLYDPAKDTVLDRRLAGTWYSQQMVWEIVQWRGGFWMRDVTPGCDDHPVSEPWPVDVVRMGKHEFLIQTMPPFKSIEGIGTMLFPCWRLDFRDDGNTLRLSLLNTVALAEFAQDHPGAMKYEEIPEQPYYHWLRPQTQPSPASTQPSSQPDATTEPTTRPVIKNMILTDDPKRIRQFLIDHADDPKLFGELYVLHRVTGI